jgi:epsilon-lactone hydrolase
MGDSAGGNLAAASMINALTGGTVVPDALIMLSPVTDFRPASTPVLGTVDSVALGSGRSSIVDYYLQGNCADDDPLASPLAASAEILAGFPPTLVQVGSDEYLRDQGVDFAAALWNAGVPVHLSVWPNMPHVFQLFIQELGCARRAIREIAEFLG